MDCRKVFVLGGGADQRDLIKVLRAHAQEIVLIDYYEHPVAAPFADRHLCLSTLDLTAVEAAAQAEQPDRIVTACTDQALFTMATVSERLGLPTPLTSEQAAAVTQKGPMKERLQALGVPTPEALVLTSPPDAACCKGPWPAVVKPMDCNGSFGITRVDQAQALPEAVACALAASRSGRALVETFVAGEEWSVDGFIVGGRAHLLLVSCSEKRADTAHFPIVRSRCPVNATPTELRKLRTILQAIVDGFRLPDGPMLVQLIRGATGLQVLEFGARLGGGAKHHLIQAMTGFDVMSRGLEAMLGLPVSPPLGDLHGFASTHYVYAQAGTFGRVTGLESLQATDVVRHHATYKRPGTRIEAAESSRDRVASYLCWAATRRELAQKEAYIQAQLRVEDPDGHDLTLHADKQMEARERRCA